MMQNPINSEKFRKKLQSLISSSKIIIVDNIYRKTVAQDIEKFVGKTLSPTYKVFLEEVGCGMVKGTSYQFNGTELISDTLEDRKFYTETIPDKAPPDSYILISNIGDEVQWYMDTAIVDEYGESPIVGWIGGLSLNDQPEWLKEQEYFANFMEFFLTKTEEM
jgi:hypothetical protein